ncbi:hypothetical protein [Nocardia lijiangensis]|uniref:hypothetical protein n=1 Tax=Nocardia lijiangensis TaxID=299618 RepID=UPI000B1E5320|nr:hypothetical protein [Nocardia lijiangensis]
MSARLDSEYRARAVNSIGDTEIDVLVIGGVVGAGAALDAAVGRQQVVGISVLRRFRRW